LFSFLTGQKNLSVNILTNHSKRLLTCCYFDQSGLKQKQVIAWCDLVFPRWQQSHVFPRLAPITFVIMFYTLKTGCIFFPAYGTG